MASYLRPRRGKKATAIAQNIVLRRGEVFFECPTSGIGTGVGKIKVGDGSTSYGSLPYFTSTEDDKVAFTNVTAATASTNNTTLLSDFSPTNTIKTNFNKIKQLLFNFNNQISSIANEISNNIKFYTFSTGDDNGQIKITPYNGAAQNVSVKGLGSAAYTNSNAYAASNHTHTGYAAANHTHNYLPLSGGTISGQVYIPNDGIKVKYFNLISQGENTQNFLNIDESNWLKIYCGGGGISYNASYHDFKNQADQWNGISASNFITQSSRRYKTNIESIKDDDAKKILDINIVKFDYIDGMRSEDREKFNQHGVIAEEVEEIIPEVVNLKSFDDKDPIPDGVDYSKFVPYLIKMVQMQQEEINELKK